MAAFNATSDGGANWTFVGVAVPATNALQITEVKGQWIGTSPLMTGISERRTMISGRHRIWVPHGRRVLCCEGFFIEVWNRVARVADSIVTFVACSGCFNGQSDALFCEMSSTGAIRPARWPAIPRSLAQFACAGRRRRFPAWPKICANDDRGGSWASSPACRMICTTCRSSPARQGCHSGLAGCAL